MPTLHEKLIAAGLPVNGQAVEGITVLFTRALTPQEEDTYEKIVNPKLYDALHAGALFSQIPGWANITSDEFIMWWNANLADSIVDGFAIPAGVKAMLKSQNMAIYRMGLAVIATRNYTRILG